MAQSEVAHERVVARSDLVDAWGNRCYIATYTEDLTIEELMTGGASQGESA
ncbi:MAG: hypothetical protein ABSH13_20000 [Candidatus Acidiferrum sp.]